MLNWRQLNPRHADECVRDMTNHMANQNIHPTLKAIAQSLADSVRANPKIQELKTQGLEFDITALAEGLEISSISVAESNRGVGLASKFLSQLVQSADASGAPLILEVGFDDGGIGLVDWYQRHGFVFTEDGAMRRRPACLSSSALELPIWSPQEKLTHIGTMKPADKGTNSLEGHGLSVSECPDAWQSIVKLGGLPRWTVTPRIQSQFLDWHRVTPHQVAAITSWGQGAVLCIPCTGFKVSWYDSECDGMVSTTFVDKASALSEFESLQAVHEGESIENSPQFEEFSGFALTQPALTALCRRNASLQETAELLAVLYVERETRLDGVFWDDHLDPAGLSAPRAVIVPDRLNDFKFKKHALAPARRMRMR